MFKSTKTPNNTMKCPCDTLTTTPELINNLSFIRHRLNLTNYGGKVVTTDIITIVKRLTRRNCNAVYISGIVLEHYHNIICLFKTNQTWHIAARWSFSYGKVMNKIYYLLKYFTGLGILRLMGMYECVSHMDHSWKWTLSATEYWNI